DVQAAVHGLSFHVARQAFETDAAIHRFKFDAPANVGNRNAAVVSFRRDVGVVGHEDLEADGPALPPFHLLRARCPDQAGRGIDPNLRCGGLRRAFIGAPGLHLRAHQNAALVPTLHRYAAVDSSVDGKAAAEPGVLLANLAMRYLAVTAVAFTLVAF